MRTLTQINVPFHSADLVIIEFNNQPFTAMRPIVEGMGLTWQSQYEKLKQRFSSVI
ncbi:phage antirepressor N-terminal domain-containing protein, partial [Acinetobacter baumannii]